MPENNKANSMIQAGPHLLESCRESVVILECVMQTVEGFDEIEECDADPLCGSRICHEIGCLIQKRLEAKAAIAKATGES